MEESLVPYGVKMHREKGLAFINHYEGVRRWGKPSLVRKSGSRGSFHEAYLFVYEDTPIAISWEKKYAPFISFYEVDSTDGAVDEE